MRASSARTRAIASTTAGSSGSNPSSTIAARSSASIPTSTSPADVQFRENPVSISTALTTARRGTVFLSLVCFAISYIALADLARIPALGPEAYLWPVMIDGTIVIGTVAVVALGGPRTAWSLLAASALVSIAGNGIHAWLTQGSWIAVGVALTPPVSCCGSLT
ncbi:DUF2637 domain-containing protein [Rhodococcoides fascians A21d2]|uniref:DUF2637 domain-containing protein n=1 Tax=Rhodococcoides fascians TaxID=1828 RepID=UPI00068B727D|nr:DUF2637 domain-containing protein [Rhodococcus fascians]QII01705.1 DUF2637 domain-containing protein [Rhodococcus fascians A21d2]